MTSLLDMTPFSLYPFVRVFKFSRCHVAEFVQLTSKRYAPFEGEPFFDASRSHGATPPPPFFLTHFKPMNASELSRWNAELRSKSPLEIVRWAIAQAPGRAIVSTNFRPYEAAILHLAVQA